MADMGVEERNNLERGLAILEKLQAEGRLAPVYVEWIERTKTRIVLLNKD